MIARVPSAPERGGRRRRAATAAGMVLASTAVVWTFAALTVLLLARGARAPRTRELVIPAGTAAGVQQGDNPLDIPPTLSFVAGDVLVLTNEDNVEHRVGPYLVPPGRSTRISLAPSGAGAFLCTIHPSGQLLLDVQPRGLDLRLTVVPTLLLGPALGVVATLTWRVVRALDVA